MNRLIAILDGFMRSDRGLRVAGIAAGVVLITSIASVGANKSTNQAGPFANDPLAPEATFDPSATPDASGSPDGDGTGPGIGPGGSTITGPGGQTQTLPPNLADPRLDFGLKTQGITDKEVKVGFSYNKASCGDQALIEAMVGSAQVGDIEKAVRAFARHINETGGIGGRNYKPLFFDDGGSGCPEKNVAAAVEMADEAKVFLAIPGLHVESDYLINRKIPVWGGREDPASLQKYGPNGLQILAPIEPTMEVWASFGKYYLGSHNTNSPPCLVRIENGAAGNFDIPQRSLEDKLAKHGLKFRDVLVFQDNASTAQQQATAGAIRLRDKGCKEVWFMAGNPVGLIFFTSAATQNNWYPKWTWTSSTALVDDDNIGNLMDQRQWENAVGLTIRVPPGTGHPKQDNCKKIYNKYHAGDGQDISVAVTLACVTVLPTAEAMRRGVKRTGKLDSNAYLLGADAIRDDFYYDAHVPMSFSFPDLDGPFKTRGFSDWTVADWSSDKAKYTFPEFPCYWKVFGPKKSGCRDLRSKFK